VFVVAGPVLADRIGVAVWLGVTLEPCGPVVGAVPGIGFWGMSERFWRRLGRLRAVARSQSDPIKFPADTGYVP
jgi:hypothetical protein